jgi:hypothetical protein
MEIESNVKNNTNNSARKSANNFFHICDVPLERQSSYSINSENYEFHVDNLRDADYKEDYEKGVMESKIRDVLECISPFLSKCIKDSENGGPGINYFKFLRGEKIKKLVEKGVHTNPPLVQTQDGMLNFPHTPEGEFNCEYHYVSQTSFYWKNILSNVAVANKDELDSYDWKFHILIVIQLPNTRGISKEKYETYAKIIEKNEIIKTS